MEATVRVEHKGGFLLVTQSGSLADEAEAVSMQQTVELAMSTSRCRRVVFDNRTTEPAGPEARASMHAWVTTPGRFERAALVLQSSLLVLSVNMDGLGKQTALRAFSCPEEAAGWVGGTG